ncbi:hypothetical protein LOAG_03460 [Loa loa]|uniref:Uncharacterized protein n=1 Tax=Loa loa TaxID=7209 RepID=A0A1S0U4D4_LOALO|nr:hypothetical protein LOAG_03460 [Loa loa]EFO25028.1 hypothetical protein LOAG_03460 [Loa loa]
MSLSESIKKSLLFEKEELDTVREQILDAKGTSLPKSQPVNHHQSLFFLTHLFCCCYPCKICSRNEMNLNTNNNLPSASKAIALDSSFLTNTIKNPSQKFSGSSTYHHSVFDDNGIQRLKMLSNYL